jgi:hypothetical protein
MLLVSLREFSATLTSHVADAPNPHLTRPRSLSQALVPVIPATPAPPAPGAMTATFPSAMMQMKVTPSPLHPPKLHSDVNGRAQLV